jgi:hypothetical protein
MNSSKLQAQPNLPQEVSNYEELNVRMPEAGTLLHAAKHALINDKQIMMDYWVDSLKKTVLIGVKQEDDAQIKILIRSDKEYTSNIQKLFKTGNGKDIIIETENSIYIVDADIPKKKITSE